MELGGEFYLDLNTLSKKKYSVEACLSGEHPLYFDSGRSALRYAVRSLRSGTILLPEYICDSVITAFSGHALRFYRLTPSLEIDMDDLLSKLNGEVSAVFLMHYFGAVQPRAILEQLEAARLRYGFSIVEDTTHSVFSVRRTIGDLCVCSLRKWFALPGGGALYGPALADRDSFSLLPRKTDDRRACGMVCKSLFLDGTLDCNAEYLNIFRKTEDALDAQTGLYQISDFSRFLLRTVDAGALAVRRKHNYARLKDALAQLGVPPICRLAEDACPLVLPVWVKDRDALRRRLMEHRIYCAVHWPFDGVQADERPLARELVAHMLSLPIDQRYDTAHIDYLMDTIDTCKGLLL